MASLVAEITANTVGLERGLDRAQSRLSTFSRHMGKVVKRAAQVAAGVTATGAAIGTALTKQSLAAIDAQAKLARQLGTTAGSLAVVERALTLSGKEFGEVREAITNMNRRLGEAARGTGPAVEALNTLGLSAREISALPLDQRLQAIATRMKDLTLDAQQQAVIMAQLGSEQGRLFNLLEDGGAVLQRATREAEAFGLAVSDVDAAKIEAANDALSTIGAVVRGISNRIAVRLAPLLERIGKLFGDAAVESEGFRAAVDRSFSFMTRAAGFVADAVHFITVGLKRINVGANVVGDAFIQAAAFTERGFRKAFDGMIQKVNNLIGALNLIPGVEIDPLADLSDRGFGKGVQRFAAESRRLVADSKLDLFRTMSEPLPSDSIKAWLAEVEASAEQATRNVVAQRQAMAEQTLAADIAMTDREKEKAALEAERMQAKLDAFRFGLLSEEEAEIESHAKRLEELALFHENQLLSESEFMALKERALEDHEARLAEIRKKGLTDLEKFNAMSWREQTSTVVGELSKMTAGVAQQNKALFNLNKAAAIAEAVINAHLGISKTLANYPFPLNVAMAAAHAAVAFAKVVAIKNTQFSGSGGGSAPSVAGTTAAQPVSPVGQGGAAAPAGSTVTVNLQGDTFDRKSVVGLMEAINEAVADGHQIRVA